MRGAGELKSTDKVKTKQCCNRQGQVQSIFKATLSRTGWPDSQKEIQEQPQLWFGQEELEEGRQPCKSPSACLCRGD